MSKLCTIEIGSNEVGGKIEANYVLCSCEEILIDMVNVVPAEVQNWSCCQTFGFGKWRIMAELFICVNVGAFTAVSLIVIRKNRSLFTSALLSPNRACEC